MAMRYAAADMPANRAGECGRVDGIAELTRRAYRTAKEIIETEAAVNVPVSREIFQRMTEQQWKKGTATAYDLWRSDVFRFVLADMAAAKYRNISFICEPKLGADAPAEIAECQKALRAFMQEAVAGTADRGIAPKIAKLAAAVFKHVWQAGSDEFLNGKPAAKHLKRIEKLTGDSRLQFAFAFSKQAGDNLAWLKTESCSADAVFGRRLKARRAPAASEAEIQRLRKLRADKQDMTRAEYETWIADEFDDNPRGAQYFQRWSRAHEVMLALLPDADSHVMFQTALPMCANVLHRVGFLRNRLFAQSFEIIDKIEAA